MDGSWGNSGDVVCHLQCEISSVEVTGLGCTGGARSAVFLRCHVTAGGGRTIQIDSQSGTEARLGGVVSWRDVASLTCHGPAACMRELADTGSVVLEVRIRRRKKIMDRAFGSVLVGRAEVAWRDVVAGDAAVERRVSLAVPARGGGWMARDDASPAPVASVRMSVRVSETAVPVRRSVGSHRETRACDWSAREDDVFGVVAFGLADDAGE